ncbi:polysaccharide export protein [Salinimonas sp. HHU 13199]|uniref:Polysaccharide export protein n=1 Tax=Salinimonas profundi TaxID=2729140 RepID=A0ABR8LGP0_9ALTE|nr:polysaccharide biosynthesis/export family protein [Salinimonas profundi]MBD3585423.1 polysaccharide export protein [Salinimonas profundi]
MKPFFLLTTTLWLLLSTSVNAQSLADLQQLRQQAQQSGQNSAPGQSQGQQTAPVNVAPMALSGPRTITSMNGGLPQNGQYYNESRQGQPLPGEPTIDSVFPEQLPMENPPYAANLFIGGFESERADGLNDNYLIAQGDKISIWMWGAVNFADVVTVDNQGNIFIPNIGPIHVANTPAGSVNSRVTSRIKQVYTNDVSVYVNLLTSTPVSVFITGPVLRPGQYAGQASDSVLYFLKRAGGIDFQRGSFRKIDIKRQGEIIATADLYDFIKNGTLPDISFKDGDVIMVRPVGATIVVETGARNSFTFEFTDNELDGNNLTEYATPRDFVNQVSIAGVRKGNQFSRYLSLDAFSDFPLRAGDTVEYIDDHEQKVYRINIQGSHTGPSQVMVDKGTRLQEVLTYIQVNQKLSDVDNIFLLRESVAQQQKEILDRSLKQLERSIYTAPISSTGEGGIRVQEAQLVSDFIARAREVEPLGKVVVSEGDQTANVLLEPNDTVVIPAVTDLIQVGGEVMMPQAVVYNPEATAADYIAWSGGFTQRADDERILVIRKNGLVEFDQINGAVFDEDEGEINLRPGDQVIVLPSIDVKSLQAVKDITQIIYQIAVAANVALD